MTRVNEILVGNNTFIQFVKNPKWGLELYHDLIAPTFQSPLYVQSWRNGVGSFGSNCSGNYSVFNLVQIDFLGVSWTSTKDHSKWFVSENGYIFIGGTNRQNGQLSRGGGGFALKNIQWANQMRNVISDFERCEKESESNTFENSSDDTNPKKNDDSISQTFPTWGISVIVIFCLLLVCIIVFSVFLLMKRRNLDSYQETSSKVHTSL